MDKRTSDKITHWRAKAQHWAMIADDGGRTPESPEQKNIEFATLAATMAAMYLALAADAEHFGALPPPDPGDDARWTTIH